jgi:hypothetical protein
MKKSETQQTATIAIRKTATNAKGVGLSHYVPMPRTAKTKSNPKQS